MNYRRLFEIIREKETMIEYLLDRGLLRRPPTCEACGKIMPLRFREDQGAIEYRCQKKGDNQHDISISARKNSWFEYCRLSIDRVLIIMYMFSVGETNYFRIIKESSSGSEKTSSATVAEWLGYCREITLDWAMAHQSPKRVGGPGVVVEVEEVKLGKRKREPGSDMEESWVLGVTEVANGTVPRYDGDFRIQVGSFKRGDEVKDAKTLLPVIRDHVEPGTIVCGDPWQAYFKLSESGIGDYMVNQVVDAGVDRKPLRKKRQRIETMWKLLKNKVHVRRLNRDMYFYEYLWRRHIHHKKLDPFEFFLECVRSVFDPTPEFE